MFEEIARINDPAIHEKVRKHLTSLFPDTSATVGGNAPSSVMKTGQSTGEPRPLTVSELTMHLKRLVEGTFINIFVEGELSRFQPASSGHYYFTLKDKQSALACVLWRSDAERLKQLPKDGDSVEVRGSLQIYESRGTYQLIVTSMKPAGIGKLYLAFVEMKDRLQAEGLFDPAHKREIPRLPKTIGIITSKSGAALQDILNVLSRRAPHIKLLIWHAQVQGADSARQIAHGIMAINALKCVDVLIVGRGGGSIEDLWSFNEEIVARAIYNSKIPVISAVGHETDTSISDFVADLRAPTPSAAAELVAANSFDLLRELGHLQSRLNGSIRHKFEFLRGVPHLQRRIENAVRSRVELMRGNVRRFEDCHALKRPLQKSREFRQRLDEIELRLVNALKVQQKESESRHSRLRAQLRALDPTAIMSRGYSITFDPASGDILRDEKDAAAGQLLRVLLARGKVDVHVAGAIPKRTRRHRTDDAAQEWFGALENLRPVDGEANDREIDDSRRSTGSIQIARTGKGDV
jgi:exodeoxyribonuclease VII large subunit